jgi:hypothetical protein
MFSTRSRFSAQPAAPQARHDDTAPASGVHAIADVLAADEAAMSPLSPVTLIVYGWQSVQPGTLWWVFPSFSAALTAARAMKNAVRWAIVAGSRGKPIDLRVERVRGTVLVEQPG